MQVAKHQSYGTLIGLTHGLLLEELRHTAPTTDTTAAGDTTATAAAAAAAPAEPPLVRKVLLSHASLQLQRCSSAGCSGFT
jgi:hypothetical protein